MWFSTASIITACCSSGRATCIRRARPIPGWGMSPSPAISLLVSTTTTRFRLSSARIRATSRSIVVFPIPGLPSSSRLWPLTTMSAHPAGETHDLSGPIPDGADPVQGPGDSRPVVPAEGPHPVRDVGDVLKADRGRAQDHLRPLEASLGLAPQVQDDLQEVARLLGQVPYRLVEMARQGADQKLQLFGEGGPEGAVRRGQSPTSGGVTAKGPFVARVRGGLAPIPSATGRADPETGSSEPTRYHNRNIAQGAPPARIPPIIRRRWGLPSPAPPAGRRPGSPSSAPPAGGRGA